MSVADITVVSSQDKRWRSKTKKERGIVHMEFMVSGSFYPHDQEEILARLPQEQAHIHVLQEQGTIQALYLSADRSHVWLVIRGASQDEVQKTLESFPLYPYVREIAIASLFKM
jgi:muconolactone delta-isomerase